MALTPYLQEVSHKVKRVAKRPSAEDRRIFQTYYRSQLRYAKLPMPDQRRLNVVGYSFYGKSPAQTLKIWDFIWRRSDDFQVMNQALIYYDNRKKSEVTVEAWPVLQQWSQRLENWAHSDLLSGIYAQILEVQPALVYPVLVKWNRDFHPWLRRQSVVSLLYYARVRKNVLPKSKIFSLIRPLLKDPEYYVQKGVGWTLREVYQIYPEATWEFMREKVAYLSPIAFTTAIEKLAPPQKLELKVARQAKR